MAWRPWSETRRENLIYAQVHYMRGGKPGFYPEIKGKGGPGGHFLFNLWDPFNFTTKRTVFASVLVHVTFPTLTDQPTTQAEQKERGLKCEILNGRAAMVGIMGMLSASTVPGSVPFLSGIEGFPQYAGNVMVPFSNDFTLTSMA